VCQVGRIGLESNVIKILHLIAALERGGTEGRLADLVRRTDGRRFHHAVVSMTGVGSLGENLAAAGIEVHSLGMKRGVPSPLKFVPLVRLIRRWKPHVIHCWMYHANLMGLLAGKMGGVPNILWSIACSDLDFAQYPRLTRWTAWTGARLSSHADVILLNSEAGRKVHIIWGYDKSRMVVIPNGFDLQLFKPDPEARQVVRSELSLPLETPLIGLLARFDPMKDHATFLRAADFTARSNPAVHFLLAGEGITPQNPELARMVRGTCAAERVHLLGLRKDTPRLTAALDIACLSSSFGEGFPNVVGEAMACEIPCVVTDVGDCAHIVGQTGTVVAPGDYWGMAAAWARLLAISGHDRSALGRAARQRVAVLFSAPAIAQKYEALYAGLERGA
jgi:glycosyltransferase involved in cell wall biosynthesis